MSNSFKKDLNQQQSKKGPKYFLKFQAAEFHRWHLNKWENCLFKNAGGTKELNSKEGLREVEMA